MQNFETMQDAARIAEQVLAGEIDPNLGCGLITAIGEKNNPPSSLLGLTLLSHEQHGHEGLGITAESCVPEILAACREFLAAQV